MLTEHLVPEVVGDRRMNPRMAYVRPCKIFSPALQRYFLGSTRDLSSGGMLVHIPHMVDVRPGDVVHIGVATKRREQFLRAVEMIKATVIRAMNTVDDHTTIAVRFEDAHASVQVDPLRAAA